MPTKNLLLCFDAFGTLFKPRTPVHHQYAEVARTFGLHGFSDEDVLKSFKTGEDQPDHDMRMFSAELHTSIQARS